MIASDETAVYHVMARTALDGFSVGDVKKDFLPGLIKRFSKLYFTESDLLGITTNGTTTEVISGETGLKASSWIRGKNTMVKTSLPASRHVSL